MSNTMKSKKDNEMYGSFYLNSSEFALAVKNIHEVVTSPSKLISMPLAPSFMLGIFNLRGAIIPVVDLKNIFKMEQDPLPLNNKKIAIVEYDGMKVGLLFDSTGQIFRNQESEKSEFTYESQDAKENVVSGAIKLEEGKRIVQILDAHALIKLEKIPHTQIENLETDAFNRKIKNQRTRKQCISFFVADNRFGLGIEAIQEIIKVPELKITALSVGMCLGMLELRGDIVPVVDFSALLKYREPQSVKTINEKQRILVLKFGAEKIGLLIDSVESIVTYYADELLFVPVLSKEKATMFSGILSKEGVGDVVLLKSDEVLSYSELSAITQGHSKLYQSSTLKDQKSKSKGSRKTYITFKIDNLYALEMHEVKELIEYPPDMIHPPGVSKFIKGMLNLRGKIVSILDVRALYGIKSDADVSTAKILIFEKKGVSYGLIVDSVEDIVSFSEEEQLKLPAIVHANSTSGKSTVDIKFAVEVHVNSVKKVILVLNLDPMTEKTGLNVAVNQTA